MKKTAKSVVRIVLFAALVTAPVVLAAEKAAPPKAAPQAAKAQPTAVPAPAPKPTLIFFLNPAGRPCQMQDQILAESKAQWEPLATLRYVRTDTAADQDVFYKYGVRSLPNLILVGPDGKELKRYSPGIQSADSVLSGIRAGSGR
ncbi:MAG: hypothetical protein IPP07_16730 [Holophagales bacterium]|jgi:hypothetical protein|nr:hypothetical protein [Holophagales bacterium]MBK9966442.1 hypothetical protein [Holophagales bacterium]